MSGLTGSGSTAGRAVGNSFTSGFGSIVGGGAIAGIFGGVAAAATNAIGNAVGSAFRAAGSAVIGFNAQLQNSTIGFESVLGSSKKATAFVGDLQKFAAKTPFDFESLVKYAQTLTGFGVSAKKVIPTLTALGDAVANSGGSTDQLNGAVLAYSQLAAKQKVDLGNILQLQNAGIPALKYLAAAYHTNVGAIQDQISAGKILSEDALPKLNAAIENGANGAPALGGAMDKLSTTFTGVVSNIKDNATQVLATAFKPLFTTATAGLTQLATALGSPKFKTFATSLAATLTTALQGVDFSNLATNIEGALTQVQALAQQVIPQIAAAFTQLGPSLSSSFSEVLPVLAANFAKLAPTLAAILPQLAEAAIKILPSLASVLLAIAPIIPPLASAIAALAPVISALAAVISFSIKNVYAPLVAQIGQGSQAFGIFTGTINASQLAAGAAAGKFGVMAQFAFGAGLALNQFGQTFGAAVRQAGEALGRFVGTTQTNIQNFVDVIASIPGRAATVLGGIGTTLVQAGASLIQGLITGSTGKIVNAIQLVGGIPGKARNALGDLSGALFGSGQALVQGFIDGINSMIRAAGNAISSVLSFIGDHFPHSPAKRGPFAGAGWRAVGTGGQALAKQFTGGFNDGVVDFALSIGSIIPSQMSSSFSGTIENASRGGTAVLIQNKTNVRLEDLIDVRVAKNSADEDRAQRLGYQPVVFG